MLSMLDVILTGAVWTFWAFSAGLIVFWIVRLGRSERRTEKTPGSRVLVTEDCESGAWPC